MRGDRVKITTNTGTLVEQELTSTIFVYTPRVDANTRQFVQANDGTFLVESLGGVNAGSTGTIQGDPIMVHKTQMKDFEGVVGLGNNDVIPFFPVFLDRYQQLGWFPASVIKTMGGGVGV